MWHAYIHQDNTKAFKKTPRQHTNNTQTTNKHIQARSPKTTSICQHTRQQKFHETGKIYGPMKNELVLKQNNYNLPIGSLKSDICRT